MNWRKKDHERVPGVQKKKKDHEIFLGTLLKISLSFSMLKSKPGRNKMKGYRTDSIDMSNASQRTRKKQMHRTRQERQSGRGRQWGDNDCRGPTKSEYVHTKQCSFLYILSNIIKPNIDNYLIKPMDPLVRSIVI